MPFKQIIVNKKGIQNGSLDVKLNLTSGVYGITLIDDENSNGKLDKSFIKVPKEGFGFSNFFLEKMKKPVFNDFKFNLSPGKVVAITVKYM